MIRLGETGIREDIKAQAEAKRMAQSIGLNLNRHESRMLSIYFDCVDAAEELYIDAATSEEYVKTVARFLFVTLAHESDGFTVTRESGLEWLSGQGGHGYAGVDSSAVRQVKNRIRGDKGLRKLLANYLFGDERAPGGWWKRLEPYMLELFCGWHRLSVAFARMRLFDMPGAVPFDPREQSVYCVEYYNTHNEAADSAAWLERYETVAHVIEMAGDVVPRGQNDDATTRTDSNRTSDP